MHSRQRFLSLIKKDKEHRLIKQRFSIFHVINELNENNKPLWNYSMIRSIGMFTWSTGVHYGMTRKTKYRMFSVNKRTSKHIRKEISENYFVCKKISLLKKIFRLNKKLRHLRNRKRRVDKLNINTVLLWKLACNYGEIKMKLVQKMMGEYSSDKIELKLFSFEGNTQKPASINALKYRFVKNSSEDKRSCRTVSGTCANQIGTNPFDLNVQKKLKKSSSLETIEKLSQHLNLIEDKIELLKKHLKGIASDNDRNILNKNKFHSDKIIEVCVNENDRIALLDQNSKCEAPDKEIVSYDITITRPLDNIEWNLNIAEIEIIDLLLYIKRESGHCEDNKNTFSWDSKICDGVFKHLPLLYCPRVRQTPLIDYRENIFQLLFKGVPLFVNLKFIGFTKMDTIIEKKLNVKINYINFPNTVRNSSPVAFSKAIRKVNEISAPNISKISTSVSLEYMQNIILFGDYSNYKYCNTNNELTQGANEIMNFKKFSDTKIVNRFTCRSVLFTGIKDYVILQNDFSCWITSLRTCFRQMEIYATCLKNKKVDEYRSICGTYEPNDQIIKTINSPVSSNDFLRDSIVLPKPVYIEDGNINNGVLTCYKRDEFFIQKIWNNIVFLNTTTICYTPLFKRISVIQIKFKDFISPFIYDTPKTKSYVVKGICLEEPKDFQEMNVNSNRDEEIDIIKMEYNTNVFNEENYGLEDNDNVIQSLENNKVIEHHNNTSKSNAEHIQVLQFSKYEEKVGKAIKPKTPTLKLLNGKIHKNKDKNFLKHISYLRNRIDKNSQEVEEVLIHFNLLNEKVNFTSKQIETDVKNMYTYVYSLQENFATTLKLVSGKINSLSLQESRSKKIAKRRTKHNYDVVKSFVQNLNYFKPAEERKTIINEDCYNKIQLNISKLRLNALVKFNHFKVYKTINNIIKKQKTLDLKLNVSMNKITKLSNQFNYDKKKLQTLFKETTERINDIENDKIKETLMYVDKIEYQEMVIDSLTRRINNLEAYFHGTVSLIHKNTESLESHLSHVEETQKHFQVETKQFRSDLSTLNNKVDSNQMEIEENSKDVTILKSSISTNKVLINCIFEEIGILKEKFDVEIWTQNEINKNVDSNLETISRIIKENVLGNRKIGLEELNDFKNIMKQNSLASTVSCENLRKLSSQMDARVLFVQTKVDNILSTLNIPDPVLVGEKSKESCSVSQSMPDME